MLKRASGAAESGPLSEVWRRLSSLGWPVLVCVVLPLLVAVVALLVEYGVIKPLWDESGPTDHWNDESIATVPGVRAQGDVWVAADGKVHVSGEVQDVQGDSSSAGVVVIGSEPAKVQPTYAVKGAGDTKRINHSSEGAVFEHGTSEIEIRTCTQNISAGTAPQCGPPKVIYNAATYWDG